MQEPKQTSEEDGILVSDFAEANPPDIDIPAMICQPEKNFFYWLASNHAPGTGAVVELGTWLGSSTAYLSAGLRGRPIYCYDWYRWDSIDNWKSDIKLEEGDDFLHLFSSNMERYGANVIVHQSSMQDFAWPSDAPIELIVIDMGKYAAELVGLLKVFSPAFIPGVTRIALQDYQYFPGYQISLVMDAIRSNVGLEHVVVAVNSDKQPNTASFLVTETIDIAALDDVVRRFTSWPVSRIHETWARINHPLPAQARARLAPGLALFLYDAGHVAEALKTLAQTPMDAAMRQRWKRLAGYPYLTDRYPDLFAPTTPLGPAIPLESHAASGPAASISNHDGETGRNPKSA